MKNMRLMHKAFKWNGISFSDKHELICFVEKNFQELGLFMQQWFSESGEIQVKTSGSTGDPKTIVLKRNQMIDSARATGDYFALDKGSKALLCLPTTYIAGKMMLVRAMVLGWELDSIPASTQLKIPVKPYDFSAMVPFQLRKSLDLCEKIKTIIVGGGEVHPDLKMMIEDHPARIFETYGMTETITHIALRPLNHAAGLRPEQIGFKAMSGVSFELDDRNCLIIKAPKISSEQIVTNDVVDLDSETSFHWLGRYDNIINSGGIKFVPEVLEKRFDPIINQRFFIGSLPDKELGQKMILLVEGDVQKDLRSKLNKFQRIHLEELSKFELPKEIYFVEHFEETISGKVKRNETIEKLNLA